MLKFFVRKRWHIFLITGVVFAVILLIPVMIGVTYYRTDRDLTAQVYNRQQTLINLAAAAVKIKIDHLVGIARSFASIDQISKDVANGRWNDAAQVASVSENSVDFYDPFIDRIIFYDVGGIQRAAYPELTGGIGSSATSSEWYRSLSQGGDSYVSNVAKRLSVPQINVVGIQVPIKTGLTANGFLVLQIPTNNFLEFGTYISLGTYGFTYIVDKKGDIVAHPQFSPQNGTVVDYSFVPAVKEEMAGNEGMMISNDANNSEKSIITYEPLPQYSWGIVMQELYSEAFASRDSILSFYLIEMIVAFIFDFLFSYLIFRLLLSRFQRQKP
jgi:hypothetical protein